MAIFKGAQEELASLVLRGIREQFRATVQAKLMEELKPLVEAAAREVTDNVMTRVEAYYKVDESRYHVQIRFDNKPL